MKLSKLIFSFRLLSYLAFILAISCSPKHPNEENKEAVLEVAKARCRVLDPALSIVQTPTNLSLGISSKIKVTIKNKDINCRATKFLLSITSPAQITVSQSQYEIVSDAGLSTSIEFTVSSNTLGAYSISLSLADIDLLSPHHLTINTRHTMIVVNASTPAPTFSNAWGIQMGEPLSLRDDGTAKVGARSFFPLGFYHVSWAGTSARRSLDMRTLSEAGFNLMHTSVLDSNDRLTGYAQFLDQAASNKMYVLTEDWDLDLISETRSKPAVFGWSIADDANSRYTPTQILGVHNQVKTADAAHFTYISMATSFSNSFSEYFGLSEAVGNQSYPIPSEDLLVVYYMTKVTVDQAVAKGKLPIANLQTHPAGGTRYSSSDEVYSMTYQSIIAGAKGILYYTYLDSYSDIATQPVLWSGIKRIPLEIQKLQPIILDGAYKRLPSFSYYVFSSAWTYNGKTYLMMVNTSRLESFNLSVATGIAGTKLVPLFIDRPLGLTISSGTVKGVIAPLQVHIYEVN